MIVQYRISSPQGDIFVDPGLMQRPFRVAPTEDHPGLTLGGYFRALEDFLFSQPGRELLRSLTESTEINPEDPDTRVVIRSEKHGPLYHIASLEFSAGKQRLKVAVSTAVTVQGKQWLRREYDTLLRLEHCFHLPHLPRVFGLAEEVTSGDTQPVGLSMVLAEWLEGYSEWHLKTDRRDGKQKISVWDPIPGHRWASEKEAWQIFKQSAALLTRYYDTRTYCHIHPWHHGAGDFVVGSRPDGSVDVKLTTARKYEPITEMLGWEEMDPRAALLYFFLHMTLRMRLDKEDGVGDSLWAGSFSLEASVAGFLEALAHMEEEGEKPSGRVGEMLALMKAFTSGELKTLFVPLLNGYESGDPADLALIRANLPDHISTLQGIIQRHPGSSLP